MNGLYLIGITNEINGSDKSVIIKKDNDHEKNKITTKLFFY